MRKTLRQLLTETEECVFAPCVYDCLSARILQLTGYEAMCLSSGELMMGAHGHLEFDFCGLTDLEYACSRITETCTLPMLVDAGNGFGDALSVYRTCKRLAQIGVGGIMIEDVGAMSDNMGLLPREQFYAKIKAAVDALAGTNTILVARTNADPWKNLEEGCERMAKAHELGAEMTTVVLIKNLEHAKFVSKNVPGWKMFPDVHAWNGVPAVTVEDITPLGFKFMTTHFLMKAAAEGMLLQAKENLKTKSVSYTFTHAPGSGVLGTMCPIELFDPQAYLDLRSEFTGEPQKYTCYDVTDYDGSLPKGLKDCPIRERI